MDTGEIIGRGRSPRQLSQVLYAHNCLQPGLYVVTQKYAIKSHLISLLSSRNHSTSVYCKNCENTIR